YSNEKIEADELKGKFYDDSMPVEFSLARKSIPKAEEGCAKDAWEEGFNQGLGGQRFHLPVRFKDPNSGMKPAYSTVREDRRACNRFRDGAEKSDQKLACCIRGFYAALPSLAKEIETLSSAKTEKPARLARCGDDFSEGSAAARGFCGYSCPTAPQLPIRYMGCYSLGFFQALTNCNDREKATAAINYLTPNVDPKAIAISAEKQPVLPGCRSNEECGGDNTGIPPVKMKTLGAQ
ncbi:MAG: hypothetical protein AABZ55_13490, partial [Bdellovibrionota bacterium]